MRKKLLAVLMTGAMVASFAGSATAVFAKSDDDNKLTVWAWDQNFNIKSMQIAADQYAKDHEGFSVDIVETSSDDCQTKLTTAANAGDYSTLPDIVLMQDNSYQKYLKSYPDAFTDLKDININWDDFGKLKQSYSMVDDTHYGVPFDNGAVIDHQRAVQKQYILPVEFNESAQQFRHEIAYIHQRDFGVSLCQERRKAAREGIAEYHQLPVRGSVRIFDGEQGFRPGKEYLIRVVAGGKLQVIHVGIAVGFRVEYAAFRKHVVIQI